MHAALANCVPATRCWNWAWVISTAAVVMFTPEKLVPGGYCTVWLFVPKLKTLGRVGLNGRMMICVVGGAVAIATPIGSVPTGILLMIVLVAVEITATLLAVSSVT